MENTLEKLKSTKGRFFTLTTKQGETLNAQYLGSTKYFANIFDRNSMRDRRIAHKSVAGVNIKSK